MSAGQAGAAGGRPGFLAELWDSVVACTVGLMIGILLLETGFILHKKYYKLRNPG